MTSGTWRGRPLTGEGQRPRVVLSSLSGRSDAAWARAGLPHADAAVLGGLALDEPTRAAARDLVARGRREFLPPDPIDFLDEQLRALADTPLSAGANVRVLGREPLVRAARTCARHGAVLELNAHCRQPEVCRAGAGERLLADSDRLCRQVALAAATGAAVSVKVRAETGVDLPALARRLETAGASAIHVDAMDTESVVAEIAAASDLYLVANNGVRDRPSTREYLDYGADAVSVGRASDEPATLASVGATCADWFGERADTDRGRSDGRSAPRTPP